MNHAGMDHGDMGHGDHGGMEDMCSMSMLFTWDTTNLCIVFRQWHIRSTPGLIFSLVAVVLLAMGYEALRALSRRFEASVDRRMSALPRDEQDAEITPLLAPGSSHPNIGKQGHLIKAVFYGVQTFYAFMLMLIFMTYNGWVMLAVSLGAFLGYLFFGHCTSATKDNACH
ncbi:CTR2 long splice variant [Metarhizium acridum CQMa 102]|uniref:Copper transport protein n=1 Tax=Metarhizium acridum (strain CQMa 102) TaxID=655827 RepID=E9EE37_METAQ|nr:CTR2 long splice variant [Metarhizium acridum CQMa 102]EFY85823.1 CTR2 long splice variant [Metarhizium acridum CQMa 102]